MTATTASAPSPGTSMHEAHRREARVGYAFIAVPMALFLTLNIFAIIYALFISFFWSSGSDSMPPAASSAGRNLAMAASASFSMLVW